MSNSQFTRRPLRDASPQVIAVAIVVVAVGLWVFLFALQRHNEEVAAKLVQGMSAVYVGKTTTAKLVQLLPTLTKYGNDLGGSFCPDAASEYGRYGYRRITALLRRQAGRWKRSSRAHLASRRAESTQETKAEEKTLVP